MACSMKYYTYIHYDLHGTPFYVGKGVKDRAFSNKDRGCQWWEHVRKCEGYTIKIVNRFDTEEEAFANEIELIEQFSKEGLFLANLTKGGKGASGYKQSEELKAHKKALMTGYVHKTVECPHCGKIGKETGMKKWHFNNCTGIKLFKSRVSISGKRIYLGCFDTKEKAQTVAKEFYDFVMEEINSVPSGSNWKVL
jgi:hypothetical protein